MTALFANATGIRAVYRQREDGDYDFMAAFANDELIWDSDIAETYAEELRGEGETVIVLPFNDLKDLVDVLNNPRLKPGCSFG